MGYWFPDDATAEERWYGLILSVLAVALTFALYFLGSSRNDWFFGGISSMYAGRWCILTAASWRKHWRRRDASA